MLMATGISMAAVAVFSTHMLSKAVRAMSSRSRGDERSAAAEDDGIEGQAARQPMFAQRLGQEEAGQDQIDHRVGKGGKGALNLVDAQRNLRDRHQQRGNGQRHRLQRQDHAGEDKEGQQHSGLLASAQAASAAAEHDPGAAITSRKRRRSKTLRLAAANGCCRSSKGAGYAVAGGVCW